MLKFCTHLRPPPSALRPPPSETPKLRSSPSCRNSETLPSETLLLSLLPKLCPPKPRFSPSMPSYKKWFTCAPVRFKGGEVFFARDSGLLCMGFQEIGIPCKAILPDPAVKGEQKEHLIRTDYQNLEDPEWWKSLDGEGVVFYGWGSGKYVKIVRAIKQAGLILVSHMDTGGMMGILNGVPEYSSSLWRVCRSEHGSGIRSLFTFAARLGYAATFSLIIRDLTRARHLKQADIIGAISPIALERIRKVCQVYGGGELAERVHLIPHPNASYMIFDPSVPKERLMVAVGRWDDAQVKGTVLLMQTAERLLLADQELCIEIYGKATPQLENWHKELPPLVQHRMRLMGMVPNATVRLSLQRAQIEICTSLREGYHTVSAEALCCGCSVVGPDVPEIPSMKWFTSHDSGSIAPRTAAGLADAVLTELALWDKGQRNPARISAYWCAALHAPKVAQHILDLVQAKRTSPDS
jgi:glycosyltransferase involved in cell wall biosynthesis